MNFKNLLKEAINNNTKIIVTGRSGWGKSEMIQQAAEELGMELVDFRLSEVLPEDIVGIPKVKDDYYEYVPPKWLYEVVSNPDKKYLLFLDEITQGTPEVLNICYKIFDKVTKVGNYTLDNVSVVGATNYSNESNYLSELPTPLKNRACMIELNHDSLEAANYLISKYELDKDNTSLMRTLRNTIESSNPRSTEKAIQLISNKCSKELCIPFVGFDCYQNLASFLDVKKRPENLTGLEEAMYDLTQGYVEFNGERYQITNVADLSVIYNLNDEEAQIISDKISAGAITINSGRKDLLTQYAIAHPELKGSQLEAMVTSNSFNPLKYIQKMKLNATTMTNQFESLKAMLMLSTKELLTKLCKIRVLPLDVMKLYRTDLPWDVIYQYWILTDNFTDNKYKEFAKEVATEKARRIANGLRN